MEALTTILFIFQVLSIMSGGYSALSEINTTVKGNGTKFEKSVEVQSKKSEILKALNEKKHELTGILDNEGYAFVGSKSKYIKIYQNITKDELSLDDLGDYVYVESSKTYYKIDKTDTDPGKATDTLNSFPTFRSEKGQEIQKNGDVWDDSLNKKSSMDNTTPGNSNDKINMSVQVVNETGTRENQEYSIIKIGDENSAQCNHSYCMTVVMVVSIACYYRSVRDFED